MSKKNKNKLPFSMIGKYKLSDTEKKAKTKEDLVKLLRKTKADVECKAYCNHIAYCGHKNDQQVSALTKIGDHIYECKICHAKVINVPELLTHESVENAVSLVASVLNNFRVHAGINENVYNDITHAMEYVYKAPTLLDALNDLDKHPDNDDGKKGKHGKNKNKNKHKNDEGNDDSFYYKEY